MKAPAIHLLSKFLSLFKLTPSTNQIVPSSINYASKYFSYLSTTLYLIILAIPGTILAYLKNKRLTLTILIPSILTLLGIFTLKTYAFRYAYFFIFPLLLFSAFLFGYLYDKYGKIIILPIALLIIIPSNLFFPLTYTNVIKPINYQLNDPSSPYTDYKNIPLELKQEIRENTLITYFSLDAEFYLKKPNFVIPSSLNGLTPDQVSINNSQGILLDRYSGARILEEIPKETFFLTADKFSTSKLFPEQREFFKNITSNCKKVYSKQDLEIFKCN